MVKDALNSATEPVVDWLVDSDSRVKCSEELVVSEGVQLLRREGGIVVGLPQHAVVAGEVLAQQGCFEQLDLGEKTLRFRQA